MARAMKRLGMPIAALLGLALVGLIATSWFINRDAKQRRDRHSQALYSVGHRQSGSD